MFLLTKKENSPKNPRFIIKSGLKWRAYGTYSKFKVSFEAV